MTLLTYPISAQTKLGANVSVGVGYGDIFSRTDYQIGLPVSLTLKDNIKFLGKQEQMEDLLPIADLFLLPSEYESFGLAALEAMAAEVPVISTNAGGLPEIIIDGSCGYMSNVGDVEDMSRNAIKIFQPVQVHLL